MIQTHQLQELKEEFLAKGGILLRKGHNDRNEPIIMHRKRGMVDFETRLTFTIEKLRNRNFDHLIKKKKEFFKSDNI